jgi:hypothetical protein
MSDLQELIDTISENPTLVREALELVKKEIPDLVTQSDPVEDVRLAVRDTDGADKAASLAALLKLAVRSGTVSSLGYGDVASRPTPANAGDGALWIETNWRVTRVQAGVWVEIAHLVDTLTPTVFTEPVEVPEAVAPEQAARLGQVELAAKTIGEPFALWDHFVDPPDNAGGIKFIRLTAGQTGTGEYNEGLLINESVTGSAPLVEATAEISTGPLAGQIVPLMNTEESFLRARDGQSGALQFDQMQGHMHRLQRNGSSSLYSDASGDSGFEISTTSGGDPNRWLSGKVMVEDPDNPQGSPRTGPDTRAKNRGATYYMRIQ